jgi:hypothetical protein
MAAPRWSERPAGQRPREHGQRKLRQRRSMRDKSRALCVESSRWKSRKMRSTKSAGAGSSGGGRRPAAKFSGPNNAPGRSLGKEPRTRMVDISHDVYVNYRRARGRLRPVSRCPTRATMRFSRLGPFRVLRSIERGAAVGCLAAFLGLNTRESYRELRREPLSCPHTVLSPGTAPARPRVSTEKGPPLSRKIG